MRSYFKFVLIFSALLLVGCDNTAKEDQPGPLTAADQDTTVFPSDTMQHEPYVARYTWGIDSNCIVPVKREKGDFNPDSLIYLEYKSGTTIVNSKAGKKKYEGVNSLRDRGYQFHSLQPGVEYKFCNGMLYEKYGDTYFMYDYTLLVAEDTTWEFSCPVTIKFVRGGYCKGENFTRFATIDTLYTNQTGVNLQPFIGTDIEIDDEIDDHAQNQRFYKGILYYQRDEQGNSCCGWYSNNFRFDPG